MKVVIKEDIIKELKRVGLEKNDVVMVHTSLKNMGYVCGGAQTIIEALLEVVGEDGTIMMPTQSWRNLDPEDGVHWEADKNDWQLIRDNLPAYDKNITPTNTMGAVAEMFRQWPGSIRSDHPARSVCALGKYAHYLTKDHDLSNIFGDGSPIARLYELDGKVLLLGVGYDKNTSIHLADARAQYPGKHDCTEYSAIMENGKRVWKKYDTLFVDGDDFEEIGSAFEEEHPVSKGTIGEADIRLMKQRDIVDYAVKWIEKNRKNLSPTEIVVKFFEDGYTNHNYDYIMSCMAENYIDHSPAGARSNADAVGILKIVAEQFSNLTVKVLDVFAEGGMVATRILYDGIHTGTCMGIPATGKHITFEALENFKVENGKITESWGYWPDKEIEQKLKAD